jgi:predicted Fe-S protein YdhL (DUF1289 family)
MTSEEVASPCINVCRMNPYKALCEGCWRTLDEIAAWSGMSAEDKRAVLARLAARRARP